MDLEKKKMATETFQCQSPLVARDISLSNQLEEDLIAVYKLAIFLKNMKNL